MKIAILGATSQIAGDLVKSMSDTGRHELYLYARRPLTSPLQSAVHSASAVVYVGDYASFDVDHEFDALINFVGIGNPSAAAKLGAEIFDITLKFDQLALDYTLMHRQCRYIYLSSGAAFGGAFEKPIDKDSVSNIPLNTLKPQDWYGAAKLHAECRHRSHHNLPIVDIRIFNYFSARQNLDAGFFICDILRSIRDGSTLKTSAQNIVRDYLHPWDFHNLIEAVLDSPATNDAIDGYSRLPINKFSLLAQMKQQFGLKFEIVEDNVGINATGAKLHYYSLNTRASRYGYEPGLTSIEGISREAEVLLNF
jgi:nucleoside-diphosphate-sugar epimerase